MAPETVVPSIAARIEKESYCSDFQKYSGPREFPDQTATASKALFHTTHISISLSDYAAATNKALAEHQGIGLGTLGGEASGFLIKDRDGKVRLLTASHVTNHSPADAPIFAVMQKEENPIVQSGSSFVPNPNVIELSQADLKSSKRNDLSVLDSPRLEDYANSALPLRSPEDSLLMDEPVQLISHQGAKVRKFSCTFRGYSQDDFHMGAIAQYFRCDNKDILLGGLSGGVIVDRKGQAIAVFNGTTHSSKSPNEKNFLRATPIFQTASGEVSLEPHLPAGKTACLPCFSAESPDAFQGILQGTNSSRQSCLLRTDGSGQSVVFEDLKD
jgi:hypothetical protein